MHFDLILALSLICKHTNFLVLFFIAVYQRQEKYKHSVFYRALFC